MHRPRLAVPLLSLATALAVGPVLAATALAADPSVTVQPGDTLTAIARRSGTTVAALVKANELADANRIYAGQRLRLRAAATKPPAPTPAERRHTIRPGEHLTGIARHYGVTIGAIVAANRITDPSRIYAGQRLVIPGAAAAPAAPKPSASKATLPAMPASMRARMEARAEIRRLIVDEARRYDVPEALALAVAWQESGWQQDVVSHAGAIGVMQLIPATGAWVGEAMLGVPVDLHDARQNVRAGVRLLRHYLVRYDGNVDLVLAAYYQGQTAADRHGVYPVSRPYVASIRALVRLLGG